MKYINRGIPTINSPRTPPHSIILDKYIFENFILADEPFVKALGTFETCVLVNNNLCEKLVSSFELPIKFNPIFKVTSVPFLQILSY